MSAPIRRSRASVRSHPAWAPWFFIAPFVLVFGTFILWPLVTSLVLAFQATYGPGTAQWVGTKNFVFMFGDPLFWQSVRNTAYFTAGSVLLQIPLALGLALLLNRPQLRGRAIYRLIFFSPSLVGLVFVGLIFSLLFEKRTGLVNVTLHGLFPRWDPEFPWLQEHAMTSVILAALWLYVGFNMIYFLAALQNVPRDLLEAASIDGATAWNRFRHVVLPHILPVGSFVVLLSIIGSLQLFELPWVLLSNSTELPDERGNTVVMYLYKNGFITLDLGYASAIGWALAVVLIIVAIGQRVLMRRREEF